MDIEFDPAKDETNQRKHGISLAAAAQMDMHTIRLDTRRAYGEQRYRAYGSIDGRLYMLALTYRGMVTRAISLRKANRKEIERYG